MRMSGWYDIVRLGQNVCIHKIRQGYEAIDAYLLILDGVRGTPAR